MKTHHLPTYLLGLVTGVCLLAACSGLVMDPSIAAVDAGDYTLAVSACEATPGGGMDICRVREGDPIQSSWKLIIPNGKNVTGWEVDIYYRDVEHPVKQTGQGGVIEIPWDQFFQQKTWTSDLDGEALALATVRYKDNTGIEKVVQFRGLAKLVVTKQGYDRLPIDSGFAAWKESCKVQYSTAGRGAVQCH